MARHCGEMVFHWTSVRAAGTVLPCSYTHSQGSDVPMNSLCFFRTPVALRRSRQVGGMGGKGGEIGDGGSGEGEGDAGGSGEGEAMRGTGGSNTAGVIGGEGGLSHTLTDTVAPPLNAIFCSVPGPSDSTAHPEFSTGGSSRGKSSRTSKHTGTSVTVAT